MDELAIRFAEEEDEAFCAVLDERLPHHALGRKIEQREIIVAEMDGKQVGYLRFEYLWSRVPFLALIHVLPEHRAQGIGAFMLEYLEEYLRETGHNLLVSSSVDGEIDPEHWHRARGFRECGYLSGVNPGGVGEVFYSKALE